MKTGPLLLDLEGTCLEPEERELLLHPQVGGLVLFTRNFDSVEQLAALVREIRSVAPALLITVDHEGGRVQRFREGFTELPPMAALGGFYLRDPEGALQLTQQAGWLIAAELIALDIDLSFAPVLDLNRGVSQAIGDRAFSEEPDQVVALGRALIQGMHQVGMAATGKHFPGHGSVEADSHTAIPLDNRPLSALETQDMLPFKSLATELDAIMPAHVIYPQVDEKPAGFSAVWIKQILRKQLGYEGVVFSDDLSMEGAAAAGGYADRVVAALDAGCDMVLVCNNRTGALEALEHLASVGRKSSPRTARLRHRGKKLIGRTDNPYWQKAINNIERFLGKL